MKYYPVIIATLNRFTHFKNCVESLARCTHAEKTELVIGLDYPPNEKYVSGYKKIKEYIPTITGFAKITVFEHETNLGGEENFLFLINYCKKHYDAYISSEDDNVFAPAFLDYMDKALELYRYDERITSIGGYNFIEAYDQGIYSCYLGRDHSAWGTGFWYDKEKKLNLFLSNKDYYKKILYNRKSSKYILSIFPALYLMLDNAVKKQLNPNDVHRCTYNIIEHKYQLKPAISLVRNCGFDGSGLNCHDDNNGMNHQPISNAITFNFGIGPGTAFTEINHKALYNHEIPTPKKQRAYALQYIYRLYLQNTNPFCYRVLMIYYAIRQKIALRTHLKNIFHIK